MLNQDLHSLLKREKNDLICWLVDCLHKRPASRYSEVNTTALEMRARELVESLVMSTAKMISSSGDGIPFVVHVERIAEERIAEGFDLDEIQFALSKLEEKIWQLVTTHRAPEEQVKELSQATQIIGSAKDHLARVYLKHGERAVSTTARLNNNAEVLARGTVSAPIIDEDDPL